MWFHKLDIRHERITPGKPQENGRLERFHLTLKQQTASPPQASIHKQQRLFDHFRKEYNDERPHEALGQEVPKDFYQPSEKRLPEPWWGRDFQYPSDWEIVRLSHTGRLHWNDRSVLISAALRHEHLGLRHIEDGTWELYLGSIRLGSLTTSRRSLSFHRAQPSKPQDARPC